MGELRKCEWWGKGREGGKEMRGGGGGGRV